MRIYEDNKIIVSPLDNDLWLYLNKLMESDEVSIILSLQGSMAVGKTTLARNLDKHIPALNVSYENNRHVIQEIKNQQLDKNKFEDYIKTQKLWLNNEISRWERATEYNCTLMDFGAEEIVFYSLNYPLSIGKKWNVEEQLQKELEEIKKCLPNRILFLDASEDVLRKHKQADTTRSRSFFDHYLHYLLPLKREWFIGKENVDLLNIDLLTQEEILEQAKEWIESFMIHPK